MMEEVDTIEKKIQIANDEAELQMDGNAETNKLGEIKKQIHELRSEMKQMNVREGFIRAKLEKERTISMQDPLLKQ